MKLKAAPYTLWNRGLINYFKKTPHTLSIAFIIFVCTALFLYPALLGEYAWSDDYRHLYRAVTDDPYFPHNIIVQGRPLYALLLGLVMDAAGDISNFVFIRIFTLLTITAVAFYIYLLGIKYQLSPIASLCLSLLAVCNPAYGVYAGWVSTFQVPLAALIALYAGNLALLSGKFPRILSAALVLCALMLYQHAAMLFWLAPLLAMLQAKDGKEWAANKALKSAIVFVVGCMLFIIIHKIIVNYYVGSDEFYLKPASRGEIADNPLHKLIWFVNVVLPDGVRMGSGNSPWITWAIAGVLVAGILRLIMQKGWVGAREIILFGAFCIASYLPSLISAADVHAYRTMLALYTFIALAIVHSFTLWSLRFTTTIMCGLTCLIVIHNAQYFRDSFLTPVKLEYNAMSESLRGLAGGNIAVIRSSLPLVPGGYMEFGGISTFSQEWAIEGMVHSLLSDKSWGGEPIKVEQFPSGAIINPAQFDKVIKTDNLLSEIHADAKIQ
jgi:hypothetical protein